MVLFGSRRRPRARTILVSLQVLLVLSTLIGPTTALAAASPSFDVAPAHYPTTGTRVVTALVRNTASSSSDTARCIRVTTAANVGVTSATYVVANPGTGAGQTGTWTLATGANFVELRTTSGSHRGLFGASNANWVRFEMTVNATAVGSGTWTARMVDSNAACSSGGSTDELAVRVGGTFSRDYSADFRDASNNVVSPSVTEGASQAYRVRITRVAPTSDDLSYAAIALPTCFTNITGISTTDSGAPSFTAELSDNFLRVFPGTKLAANGEWVQVHFTATASCTAGSYTFRTAAWKNSQPETAVDDIFKLSGSEPTLVVVAADVPPVAVDDTATVGEDAGASTIDVLANDTDTDGGPMAVQSVTDPANGAAAVTNAGANVSYTPDSNFCGTDTFDYELNGGSTATVTVTVTCDDDAPVAVDDAVTIDEDSPATTVDVLANDTDVDGGPMAVQSVTDPANGTAAVTNAGADVSYTPDADFCGTDSFDYTINGGDTATVTVTVTCVDDLPVAVDDAVTVDEDSSATTVDVLANDTDVDGGPMAVQSVTDPANGTAAVTNAGADVSYTPDAGFCGTDTFDYELNGGSTATVTVTVTCDDDSPVAVDDTATVDEDSGANTIDVLANDTDTDGGSMAVQSVTDPANGAAAVTNAGADVSYTPDAGFCGTDTFDYELNGGSTATVTVTVTCLDDAPVAVDDAITVDEDSGATTVDVLANDTDVDGGAMAVESVTNPPNGSASVTNSGADVGYTPDADFCGTDSFDYTLNGGSTATVTVTVTCVDDLPVAVDDTATVGEDSGATTIDVLANDTDVDGGPMAVQSVTDPASGTAAVTNAGADVSYTPDAGFCGTDTFDYTLNGGSTATVTVTVTCDEDSPVAVDDTATVGEDSGPTTIDVLANDLDTDGGSMAVQSVTDPAHGAAAVTNGGADVSYTPDANFCGSDSFTYTLNGGSTATVTVTVTCADDAPVAVDDAATVGEDSGATAIDVLDNDTDVDGGSISIQSVTNPPHGTAIVTNGGTVVTYVPDAGFCGTDTFTYTINGGSTATVTVTVTCVDDPPIAVADSVTIAEDSAATTVAVRTNDLDPDGGAMLVVAVTNPPHGTAIVTNGGADITYIPDADFCGTDSFTYTLNGGSTATVTVTVTCVADTPAAPNPSPASPKPSIPLPQTDTVVERAGAEGSSTMVPALLALALGGVAAWFAASRRNARQGR